MIEYFPDFLRGMLSSFLNITLLFTMPKPKASKMTFILYLLGVWIITIVSSLSFYMKGDLTGLAKFNLLFYLTYSFALKPLFWGTWPQWTFNVLTTGNIFFIILVVSHIGSWHLNYAEVGNIVIRTGLFLASILVFKVYHRSLYQRAQGPWRYFCYLQGAVFFCFLYFIVRCTNIADDMRQEKVYLFLLILLAIVSCIIIYHSFKQLSYTILVEMENSELQAKVKFLDGFTSGTRERMESLDKEYYEKLIIKHDRRHYNNILLELLRAGGVEKAIALLDAQSNVSCETISYYCENATVNAAVSYYVELAKQQQISFTVQLDIPSDLVVDSLDLAITISNLLENAINGCKKLPEGQARFISFRCFYTCKLVIQIENSCLRHISLDQNYHPFTSESGHGIGTKSVVAFQQKYEAYLRYRVENGVFSVQLII